MDAEKICLPSTYYHKNRENATFHIHMINDVKKYGYGSLAVIFLISAPFLIFPPFFLKKLSSKSRKIVAMVIVSDVITSLSALIGFAVGEDDDKYDFDDAISSASASTCYYLTVIRDIGFSSSLIWTGLLFGNLFLAVFEKVDNSAFWYRERFMLMNLIGWPLGILINIFEIIYLGKYKIVYSLTYLQPTACRLNYTFIDDGSECIIGDNGRLAIMGSGLIKLTIIAIIWILLVTVIIKARQSYVKYSFQAEIEDNSAYSHSGTGFSVARDYSHKIYKCALQFSIPTFIYTFAFLPVISVQLYELYNGPVGSQLHFDFVMLFVLDGLLVAFGNLLFYGFLSKSFRSEMRRLFRNFVAKIRKTQVRLKHVSRKSVNNGEDYASQNSFEPYSPSEDEVNDSNFE